jgi:acetolactate synthase-1/2/3 large subunit
LVVSDYIAWWLGEKEITHAFGIIGAGNAAIFDSINRYARTELVCVHHEQAATMACQAFWRTNGRVAVALVTTGGGSANAVTGVVSAWMDSIPIMIISGNEARDHCETQWRGWGVQGFDSVSMVKPVTKWSKRVLVSRQVPRYLEEAYACALSERPGPVWLDIPRDIQLHDIPDGEQGFRSDPLGSGHFA